MHSAMLAFVFMAPAETWDRATTKPACSRRSRKDQHRARLGAHLQRLSATSIQSTNCEILQITKTTEALADSDTWVLLSSSP